jgi:hypothetical protein
MKKNTARVVAVAAISATVLAGAAVAASAYPQTNGSDAWFPLYNDSAALTTSGAFDGYTMGSASNTNVTAPITCPAGSTGAFSFVSAAGKERTAIDWKASAPMGLISGGVTTPEVTLSSLVNGAVGAVQSAGGTYSLGLACTSNNGVTVTGAYYATISVTAGTGAWTRTDTEATAPVAHAPAFTLQPAAQTGAPAGSVTFTAAASDAVDNTISYQWETAAKGSSSFTAVSGATSASLTVSSLAVANDGDQYRVVATNTAGSTTSNVAVLSVLQTKADIALSAAVAATNEGYLSISVPAGAAASFGTPSLVNNQSVTEGTLPNITVADGRVHGLQGWDLSADVDSFKLSTDATNTIANKFLGITPTLGAITETAVGVSTTGVASVTAGTTAGSATYPATLASANAGIALDSVVVAGSVKFIAPQEKVAGTYNSTLHLTAVSK